MIFFSDPCPTVLRTYVTLWNYRQIRRTNLKGPVQYVLKWVQQNVKKLVRWLRLKFVQQNVTKVVRRLRLEMVLRVYLQWYNGP